MEKYNWMETDIRFIGYTKKHETLQFKFHDEAVSEYYELPPEELENFKNDYSQNKFLTRMIRLYCPYSPTVILIKFSLEGSFRHRVISQSPD